MLTEHSTSNRQIFHTAKGNPRELLNLCSHYYENGKVKTLTKSKREEIIKHNNTLSEQTLRVLGVAYRNFPSLPTPATNKYVWYGLVALKDKIKMGVSELLHSLEDAGIQVSMITGDQAHTANAIAKAIGLGNGKLKQLNTQQLDSIEHSNRSDIIAQTNVFSRVSPEHKLQIVDLLQKQDKVVAMTGDGINDGPALKKADIGIAMGAQGSDVAIEVADAILLDDDLATILKGIEEGRNIQENIKRSVEFIMATNMGEIGLAVTSQLMGLAEPCTATQYLWINLLTDIFPEIALASEPARDDILSYKPTMPGKKLIERSEISELAVDSSAMVAAAMISYLWGLNKYGMGPSSRTMAFLNLTSAQMYYMLGTRFKAPLWETGLKFRQNPRIPLAFISGIGLQNLAFFTPMLRNILGMSKISLGDWIVAQSLALTPLLVHELKKNSNIQKEIDNAI